MNVNERGRKGGLLRALLRGALLREALLRGEDMTAMDAVYG